VDEAGAEPDLFLPVESPLPGDVEPPFAGGGGLLADADWDSALALSCCFLIFSSSRFLFSGVSSPKMLLMMALYSL